VADAVEGHLAYLKESDQLRIRSMRLAEEELRRILGQELLARLLDEIRDEQFEFLTKEVAERELDPYTAADSLLASFFQSIVGKEGGGESG
jgi:LAO/AO transport system kinase